MVRKHKISKYKYEISASGPENVGVLYLIENGKTVCVAIFTDEKGELPPPREDLNGIVYTAYKFNWLQSATDMLRYEKPVYFTWDQSAKVARITTDEEPVGEEEHKSILKFLFG